MKSAMGVCLLVLLILSSACRPTPTPTPGMLDMLTIPTPSQTPTVPNTLLIPTPTPEPVTGLKLTSPAFAQEGNIPPKYTCNGEDKSPPLAWNDPPTGTKSIALTMEDPDAPLGIWGHWVLYNLPPTARSLAEGISIGASLPDGSLQGANSARRLGYSGPCPPSGTHRYFFRLYALDTVLQPEAGKDKKALTNAMEGHILAQAELMGTYSK
jgi:Raf kinase inhibitor-like YbhB/YbcL family protein